jgi:hypothetical protein
VERERSLTTGKLQNYLEGLSGIKSKVELLLGAKSSELQVCIIYRTFSLL